MGDSCGNNWGCDCMLLVSNTLLLFYHNIRASSCMMLIQVCYQLYSNLERFLDFMCSHSMVYSCYDIDNLRLLRAPHKAMPLTTSLEYHYYIHSINRGVWNTTFCNSPWLVTAQVLSHKSPIVLLLLIWTTMSPAVDHIFFECLGKSIACIIHIIPSTPRMVLAINEQRFSKFVWIGFCLVH